MRVIVSPSQTDTVDIVSSVLGLRTCKVCGEERPMLASVMVDVPKKEFNHIELDFTVELGLHVKMVSLSNFGSDAVGLIFRQGSPASTS